MKDNGERSLWKVLCLECMSEYKIFFALTLFVRVYVTYEIY